MKEEANNANKLRFLPAGNNKEVMTHFCISTIITALLDPAILNLRSFKTLNSNCPSFIRGSSVPSAGVRLRSTRPEGYSTQKLSFDNPQVVVLSTRARPSVVIMTVFRYQWE